MKVSDVSRKFSLSKVQENSLKSAWRVPIRKERISAWFQAAQFAPDALLVQLKASLLAELSESSPALAVKPTAPAPATTTPVTAPAAPVKPAPAVPVPPVPKPRVPLYLCVGGQAIAYTGQDLSSLPVGSLVHYADSQPNQWEPVPTIAPPAPVPPAETRVSVDLSTAPRSLHAPEYPLPWVLGANVGKDGVIYCTIGQHSAAFRRCSMRLDEAVILFRDHSSSIVDELARLKSRLS